MTTNLAELENGLVGDDNDPPTQDAIHKFAEEPSNVGIADPGLIKIKVLSQALLSPNEAVLVLNEQFGADGAGVSGPLTLRNIQGVWKVVVFNTRDADGKVTSLDLYKSR